MILVLGSNGQLGRELLGLSRIAGLAMAGLPRQEADIADAEAVARALDAHRPTLVVNAGAYTKVDLAEQEPDKAWHANALGPEVLAKACAAAGIPLVHVSTDYVFDGTKDGAYREDDPIAPLGVYGRSKAAGEAAIRAHLPAHVILRTSWVYGVHGANFLKTMLRLAAERDELRVVADQRGCPTSTLDLARAILAVAGHLRQGGTAHGTYHFAGQEATTWHGFAARIVEGQAAVTGRSPTVTPIRTEHYPTPARRPANSELDSGLFARTFGFTARPWQEATDDAVARLAMQAAA